METRLLHEVPTACRQISCGRTTLYKLAADGEIELVKIGRKTLVPAVSLEAYVDRLRDKAHAGRGLGELGDGA
jgi:excisionase family DNA binding protein